MRHALNDQGSWSRWLVAVLAGILWVGLLPISASALGGTFTFGNGCGIEYDQSYLFNHAIAETLEDFDCSQIRTTMRYFDSNNGQWDIADSGYTATSPAKADAFTGVEPDWSRHYGCNGDCRFIEDNW